MECGGGKFVRLWGCDDYSWWWVKELEFGVKWLIILAPTKIDKMVKRF